MPIAIYQAIPEDAAEILALQKTAYLSEAQLYGNYEIPPLIETLSQIKSEFNTKTFLKAMDGDKIIGSVRSTLDGKACAIGRLMVHPDYQGRSIGAQLMEKIEECFSIAERFELFTGSKSTGNIRFYQKLGYRTYREEDLSEKVRIVFLEKRTGNHRLSDSRP